MARDSKAWDARRFERAHSMTVSTGKSWLEGAAGLHDVTTQNNVFEACCTPKHKQEGKARRHLTGEASCDPISIVNCANCTTRNNSFTPAR